MDICLRINGTVVDDNDDEGFIKEKSKIKDKDLIDLLDKRIEVLKNYFNF